MYELLTRPEIFHEKRVRVTGYAQWDQPGDDALYPNAEDAAGNMIFNAIALGRPAVSDSLRNGYVLVEGTFRVGPHGHLGGWRAGLGSVTRLGPWSRTPIPPPESIPDIDLRVPSGDSVGKNQPAVRIRP